MNTKAIYFDMDGTIADLYGVNEWLPKLRARDASPYKEARPMLKMQPLARRLNTLQKKGYKVGIVSWLSKAPPSEYDNEVDAAKREWLNKHLHSVHFDELIIVAHGTPKQNAVACPYGILFDDEQKNRNEWRGRAYEPEHIMNILGALR